MKVKHPDIDSPEFEAWEIQVGEYLWNNPQERRDEVSMLRLDAFSKFKRQFGEPANLVLEVLQVATNQAQSTAAAEAVPSDLEEARELLTRERSVTFTPVGQDQPISVTPGQVRNMLARRARSGRYPETADVVKFIMLCKARGLDPWIGDAHLIGYDNKQGSTDWSLIISHQAFMTRAEAEATFDGMRSGITYANSNGDLVDCEGEIMPPKGCILAGGWAEVYRKDRKLPVLKKVNLSAYQGASRWNVDPAGMIVKVAEAKAIRTAYPFKASGVGSTIQSNLSEQDVIGAAETLEQRMADQVLDQSPPEPEPTTEDHLTVLLSDCGSLGQISEVEMDLIDHAKDDGEIKQIHDACEARRNEIRSTRGENSNRDQKS